MKRPKILCLAAIAALFLCSLMGCGKDATTDAPPPAGQNARPADVQTNKAATVGNPGAAAPSDGQVK